MPLGTQNAYKLVNSKTKILSHALPVVYKCLLFLSLHLQLPSFFLSELLSPPGASEPRTETKRKTKQTSVNEYNRAKLSCSKAGELQH